MLILSVDSLQENIYSVPLGHQSRVRGAVAVHGESFSRLRLLYHFRPSAVSVDWVQTTLTADVDTGSTFNLTTRQRRTNSQRLRHHQQLRGYSRVSPYSDEIPQTFHLTGIMAAVSF